MFINLFKNKTRTLETLFIVLIIFLALFPRSVEVLNQNPIFGFDQGRDYQAAKNIAVNHKITLIGPELGAGAAGLSGIFQGPYFYYFLAGVFILFNGNPMGSLYLVFALSMGSIILGYVLGNKVLGKRYGLVVALLISICPILISHARFFWNPHTPSLFVLATFYFTYLFIKEKKHKYIFLAAFFSGFIYGFEFAVSIPLCITLLFFSFYIIKTKVTSYLYLIAGFLLAFLPMILFEIRHNFLALNGFLSYFRQHSGNNLYGETNFLIDHIRSFIYNLAETFPLINFNIALLFFFILITTSIYMIWKEKDRTLKQFMIFLLLLLPVNFFVFNFLKNTVWTYYLTSLNLAYIFLFTYIFYALFKKQSPYRFIPLVLTILFIILALKSSIKTTIYDYSDYGGTAKLKGKIDAIEYVYKDANKKPFGLFVFTPPIYTYSYDYLIWWYGQKKYNYIPNQDKKGTFYLLIEEDPDKLWRSKGWLETVIGTGEIVWTRKLPSGFILQKRMENVK